MNGGIPEYDELDVRIEPDRGRRSYRVAVSGPRGSGASTTFTVPFDETKLENFVLKVGMRRREVRAYRSSQMEEAKKYGNDLFKALFKGEVHEVYRDAWQNADAEGRGLRLRLSLTGVPKLLDVPWEYLHDGTDFLAQSIYTPVVRSLDVKRAMQPRKLTLPLQILGMVSRPRGLPELDTDEEKKKLENALRSLTDKGLVELRWLEQATMGELHHEVSKPKPLHVFHYVGHGAYEEAVAGSVLVFEDADGGPHSVTGEELGALLRDERSLRLVVLNACEGARSSHHDPFSGVAASLIQRDVAAVVAMQFEITDRAAITLAERLYTALSQGYPIDAALAQARMAMWAAGTDVEFGTPVLFLRTSDARLFEVDPSQTVQVKTAVGRVGPAERPTAGAAGDQASGRRTDGKRRMSQESSSSSPETAAPADRTDVEASWRISESEEWRSELLETTGFTRSVRVVSSSSSHIIEFRRRWINDDVVLVDGATVWSGVVAAGAKKSASFEVADHPATIMVKTSVFSSRIVQFQLSVAGRVVYSEGVRA